MPSRTVTTNGNRSHRHNTRPVYLWSVPRRLLSFSPRFEERGWG